jgi:hypothetical protein
MSKYTLEHFSFMKKEAKVCYHKGKRPQELERMDYLEFIARFTSHIPDKGQVTVRYYSHNANAQPFLHHH